MAYLTSGKKKLLGSNTEGKGINIWQPNTEYKLNDLCLYKETNYYSLYICVTEHTSGDAFDESNWEQLTYGIDELTKEDVEGLLGLTEEEIETMADLISDTEVRIDKTYSSSKIHTNIQQCLEDSKTYTDEQVATMNVDITDLENRVATNKADITDLQEQTSDLQEQIDNLDILEQVDLTGINTKLSQLETKANLIPIVADDPTDYDLNNYKENGNYSISDSSKYSNVPINQPALLTVIRSNSYRLQIYTVVYKDNVYFRKSTNGGNTWSDWKELATMDKLNHSTGEGEDVPKTTITPVFPNGVIVGSGGATINYIVRNGWCNVDFSFNIKSATALTWNDIATGLPKPANNVNIVLINDGGKTIRTIPIKINSTGSISSRVPAEISTADWWASNVSYPVAE